MARILITDDDADIRNLLKIILNNDGHEVTEAANGDEAITLCTDADLILLYVMMPITDGFSACPEI